MTTLRVRRFSNITITACVIAAAATHCVFAQSTAAANCGAAPVAEGCGTYSWPDGSKYVGQFKAGILDGHGVVTYADGSKFEADFARGTAYGNATYTARDGTRTSGPFHNIGNDSARPRAQPKYPFWRSILGGDGTVTLTVIVAEDGSVTNAKIDDPSPHPDYGDAALTAVTSWKYQPATVSGVPVKVPHRIEINFPEPRG